VLSSYVEPAVGALRIREATVEHSDRALATIRQQHGRASAKSTRTVLSGMLGYAARRGAINTNPIKYTSSIRRGRNNVNRPRALTSEETQEVLSSLRGMKRAVDLALPDLVTLMLGTGCRIGDACAMRKAFNAEGKQLLDLEAGTWEVNATVIRVQGIRRLAELLAKGRLNWEEQEELALLLKLPPGLHVQQRPKTGAGWRRIALPLSVVDLLRRRENELRLRGPVEVIFGSPKAVRCGIRPTRPGTCGRCSTRSAVRHVAALRGYPVKLAGPAAARTLARMPGSTATPSERRLPLGWQKLAALGGRSPISSARPIRR
jgi:integrase